MIALLAFAALSAAECPTERAQYSLRGRPDISASFRSIESGKDWPSHVALAIRSGATGKTTWWLPWQGGTDGRTNIAVTTDVTMPDWAPPSPDDGPRPFGDRQFIATDSNYTVMGGVPRLGEPAPAHMLNPEAGGSGDYIFPVKQFFGFVGCSRSGG